MNTQTAVTFQEIQEVNEDIFDQLDDYCNETDSTIVKTYDLVEYPKFKKVYNFLTKNKIDIVYCENAE